MERRELERQSGDGHGPGSAGAVLNQVVLGACIAADHVDLPADGKANRAVLANDSSLLDIMFPREHNRATLGEKTHGRSTTPRSYQQR